MDFVEALDTLITEPDGKALRRDGWPETTVLFKGKNYDGQDSLEIMMAEGQLSWMGAGADVLADDWSVVDFANPAVEAEEDPAQADE